jgi:uncharacterized protein (TIGR03437 family)
MLRKVTWSLGFLFAAGSFLSVPAVAQRNRIANRIDDARRVALTGHLHPRALPENDEGSVDPALALSRVTLVLQPSSDQQAQLKQLLAEQQDPSSPNYHHWLTPEQYAERFGVSQADVNRITSWLQSQQLAVSAVASGRNWIAASGTAAAVDGAFGTHLHRFRVNGELHFANATEPTIPAGLGGVVKAIHGLHDFRMTPRMRPANVRPGVAQPGTRPEFTSGSGNHYLAPDDIANIYNIRPLYSSGVTGSGQKLAVMGQTAIDLADIRQYRTFFNLPANDPQTILVPGSTDPGISQNDLTEADLDVEIAGAIAPDAAVLYVYSGDVATSLQYAIDQNLAPVISISYGFCEAETAASDALTQASLGQQANAQGITWLAASGDSGAADCSTGRNSRFNGVLSADLPASLPEVTGVGGTTFLEGTGSYWNKTNDADQASALSYIPETAWNDTPDGSGPAASGGGVSVFFPKPGWQTGPGVPSDGARDVPDIAFSASPQHDGTLIFTGGSEQVVGGTSVGAPAMAGLMALLNQYVMSQGIQSGPGLGNINPQLYGLAQASPASFHDITSGDNIITVTCTIRQRNCQPGSIGYSAGAGYDPVTGLGSVDAHALFTSWVKQATANAPPSLTVLGDAASLHQQYTPGMLLTIYGQRLSPGIQVAASTPWPLQMLGVSVTINGVPAPLYYVSPGELNVQIPYETPVNTSVVLAVNNNGRTTAGSFTAAAAAPGIFTDPNNAPVPYVSAARGQAITLYLTGFGAVTPAISTGAGPKAGTPLASLPHPQQKIAVTVGGVPAPSVSGVIPWGYVGVMQVTYQVPGTAPLGAQAVVVTIGGVSSAPATLTVTP